MEIINGFKRLKRITSHAGHARFLAEIPGIDEEDWTVPTDYHIGEIPRQKDIPSPYHYSPTWNVSLWRGKRIIIVETAHKRYDVFELPEQMPLIPVNG